MTKYDDRDDKEITTGNTGKHARHKEDKDVKMIFMMNTTAKYIPENYHHADQDELKKDIEQKCKIP